MNKFTFLFLLFVINVNAQEQKLHTVNITIPLENGKTTRSVAYFLSNGDTLAQSTYVIKRSGEKVDFGTSKKVPYKVFVESEKARIIEFTSNKMYFILKDEYKYTLNFLWPDLWYHSVMDTEFILTIIANEKTHKIKLNIMMPVIKMKDIIFNELQK